MLIFSPQFQFQHVDLQSSRPQFQLHSKGLQSSSRLFQYQPKNLYNSSPSFQNQPWGFLFLHAVSYTLIKRQFRCRRCILLTVMLRFPTPLNYWRNPKCGWPTRWLELATRTRKKTLILLSHGRVLVPQFWEHFIRNSRKSHNFLNYINILSGSRDIRKRKKSNNY